MKPGRYFRRHGAAAASEDRADLVRHGVHQLINAYAIPNLYSDSMQPYLLPGS